MNERQTMKLDNKYLTKTRDNPGAGVTDLRSFSGGNAEELEQLKNRLLRPLIADSPDRDQNKLLHRAANEAAALVWLTACPLLLFPALLEEKAKTALVQR